MRFSVKESHGLAGTTSHDILRAVAELCSKPDQAIAKLAELLKERTGAHTSVVVLLSTTPAKMVVAGADQQLDASIINVIKEAASLFPAGTVGVINLDDQSDTMLLAPVYRDDNLRGAVCLFTAALSSPDSEVFALLQNAVHGVAILDYQLELVLSVSNIEQFAASVIAAISDPLIALDAQRRVVSLNSAAHQLFNLKQTDVVGQPLDSIVVSEELRQLIENCTDGSVEWMAEDGRVFVPRVQVVQGNSDERDQRGWIVILRDITRFKRLIRNQSEFTRVVSHDLRSPMTSMQGFASMLEMVGELTDKQKYYVEKILSGISQMTALVDNIQDAGRYDPETGFYELSRTPCDICELVSRVVNDHLVPAEKQELTLTTDIAPDVPILSVDAHMLERAVTNLIDNAIKYTPNGGKVCVAVRRDKDDVVISVRDNGLGISPENQKFLFERHFRIARQEHRRVKGSGLGLFIVRSVAQRHGGRAWVESAEGQGSTFFISIPIDRNSLVNAPCEL